jgi:hypothetical protein
MIERAFEIAPADPTASPAPSGSGSRILEILR